MSGSMGFDQPGLTSRVLKLVGISLAHVYIHLRVTVGAPQHTPGRLVDALNLGRRLFTLPALKMLFYLKKLR